MSNRCECGHHRLTHTYTREANIGPCSGWDEERRCSCKKYEPEEES